MQRGNDMKVSLNNSIFNENEVDLKKKVTVIYGQNGTGKTTLAQLITNQYENEYDVRVFNGFDKVVGVDGKLNAVILGIENKEIDDQIKEIEAELKKIEDERKQISQEIIEPTDKKIRNDWTERHDLEERKKNAVGRMESLCTKAAAEIKNDPRHISEANYNKTKLQNELADAEQLSDDDKKAYETILNERTVIANNINFPSINPMEILGTGNRLLKKYVREPVRLDRLDTTEKKNFAQMGLRIHKPGEICAFCGNVINDNEFFKLQMFFNGDEIAAFRKEVVDYKTSLKELKKNIDSLSITKDNFYSKYAGEAEAVSEELEELKNEYRPFLDQLIDALQEKENLLTKECAELGISSPDGFHELQKKYISLVEKNNNDDIRETQNDAKQKLRLHEVFVRVAHNDNYMQNQGAINEIEILLEKKSEEIKEKKQNIKNLDDQIRDLKVKITELQASTVSEAILSDHINQKLKGMVNFSLVQAEEGGKGHYVIQANDTGEIRPVDKVSTGEKNIIAFLYFVEKLDEVSEDLSTSKKKIIVFDDPMSSNDDNMQYLIMDNLLDIMKRVNKPEQEVYEQMVVMTHNRHFYINILYGMDKKVERYHLNSFGGCTKFELVDKNSDFKTSYESLWMSLKFLYDHEDAQPEMLLNPARRIIETYCKFNGVNQHEFYEGHGEAKKLFNVNSHSIDDLQAELNGKTKDQIIDLMKECFDTNHALQHFDHYWNVGAEKKSE